MKCTRQECLLPKVLDASNWCVTICTAPSSSSPVVLLRVCPRAVGRTSTQPPAHTPDIIIHNRCSHDLHNTPIPNPDATMCSTAPSTSVLADHVQHNTINICPGCQMAATCSRTLQVRQSIAAELQPVTGRQHMDTPDLSLLLQQLHCIGNRLLTPPVITPPGITSAPRKGSQCIP